MKKISTQYIDYSGTGFFSKLVLDYISGDEKLKAFYEHPCTLEGIKASIQNRKQFSTDRKLLVSVLKKQYSHSVLTEKQKQYLSALENDNCFTVTTAHQPNIFTGPLFFIYKILHAVRLAAYLKSEMPENNFVPVYYMGSEDADIDELGHVNIMGEKYEWKTKQTGAVGRMIIDDGLLKLIDRIEGQVAVYPFGHEIIEILRRCYVKDVTVEQATFALVNQMFSEYGLLILLPDNSELKNIFVPVVEKELKEQFSHSAVLQTINEFPKEYKTQVSGRELNLFYLKDDKRVRIEIHSEKTGAKFKVQDLNIEFNKEEIISELKAHPERFSPNVILRPVFQATVLPDVAFIGGGGELAYWLELKKVFSEVNVPYPVLVLRNSFLIVPEELQRIANKLEINDKDLFKKETVLLNELVKRESSIQLNIQDEMKQVAEIYSRVQQISEKVDSTLQSHVAALEHIALKKLGQLEKKMISAEKKKFQGSQRQLEKLKKYLFPNDSLQERIDNFIPYFAKYGPGIIREIYSASLVIDSEFSIMKVKDVEV